METKRPDAAPQRGSGSTPARRPGSASQRRPGSTPQRRPPARYPPPRPRPSPPPGARQSRPYPPPRIPKANQTPPPIRRAPSPRPAAKPEPEPRFRDALFPKTPDAPALNRIAFVCGLLYALIHAACGTLLVYPLNVLTARMPFPLAGIVRAFLPALIGAVFCALTRYPLQLESRVGLSAYRKLLRMVLTLSVFVLLLMWGEWEAQKQVARFALTFVCPPLMTGTALSVLLFYFDWRYELEDDEDA